MDKTEIEDRNPLGNKYIVKLREEIKKLQILITWVIFLLIYISTVLLLYKIIYICFNKIM